MKISTKHDVSLYPFSPQLWKYEEVVNISLTQGKVYKSSKLKIQDPSEYFWKGVQIGNFINGIKEYLWNNNNNNLK